jgi:hypothetical protein
MKSFYYEARAGSILTQIYSATLGIMDNAGQQRFAFVFDRIQKGWAAEIAGPVAWALIPFDDSPVPPRSLEKQIRKRCKSYAKELRNAEHNQDLSLSLAISVAQDYVNFARQNDSQYFIEFWQRLKEQAESARNSS